MPLLKLKPPAPVQAPRASTALLEPRMHSRQTLLLDTDNYERTLSSLRQSKNRQDPHCCDESAFEHGMALSVFRQALNAHLQGEFKDFKYSAEFRAELSALYGPDRADALFALWKEDVTFLSDARGANYSISETGEFTDSFYGGLVRDVPNCQDPRGIDIPVVAITGTIELPWIKQMLVREEGSPDIVLRSRIYLMHKDDGNPMISVQPRYSGLGVTEGQILSGKIMHYLRSKYGQSREMAGLEVEVRCMPNSMISKDVGLNTGYRTYSSGRSPFFYIDSNCHTWNVGAITYARNGLYSRNEGQAISFPPGWSSEFDMLKEIRG
jgi:hypothetical protein